MTPIEKFLLFVAAPAVLVFALIEAAVLSRRQRCDWSAVRGASPAIRRAGEPAAMRAPTRPFRSERERAHRCATST